MNNWPILLALLPLALMALPLLRRILVGPPIVWTRRLVLQVSVAASAALVMPFIVLAGLRLL